MLGCPQEVTLKDIVIFVWRREAEGRLTNKDCWWYEELQRGQVAMQVASEDMK